jgi:hypothetical protein
MNKKTTTMISLILGVMLVMPAAFARGQSGLKEARQGTAAFHNVSHAEAAGYGSTLDTLGCFENPGVGGMGVHYLNVELLNDPSVDPAKPEALVYEMDASGDLKLVGLEYIVLASHVSDPASPPALFGHDFHPHPVLPLYVLHAWVWQPNPLGLFEDWNPRVALCPDGVPIFGS